jgi:CDP-diacylglycerol--glycerol-3-phosphate 3-phosphatidyltransferase
MRQGSLVSHETRDRVRSWAVPVATALGRLGLTPNTLTVLGFAGTCVAAVAAGAQAWALAGVLVLVFGIFDMVDGALARATGRATRFGAFLDSTLDRTGENLVLAGIAFGLAFAGQALGAGLAALAMATSSMVTYTRAKAESLAVQGEVGISPRPERLVLIGVGLIAAGFTEPNPFPLALALAIIAAVSAVTVLQRIVHVRRQLDQQENS